MVLGLYSRGPPACAPTTLELTTAFLTLSNQVGGSGGVRSIIPGSFKTNTGELLPRIFGISGTDCMWRNRAFAADGAGGGPVKDDCGRTER